MNTVEVKDIVKFYNKHCAVDKVSFSFSSGKLTALCGRNGSGKTTSIKCLLGILKRDGGEIIIDGKIKDVDKKRVGYLPEERGLFIKERVDTQLELFAKLKGLKRDEIDDSMRFWLKRFGIEEYRKKRLDNMSKGNQQKVQMIAALIHNPDIIILDEPFSGLDPLNMQLFIEIIQELKKQNKCILVSSHQLSLIEGICEDICIIDKGKCVYSGAIIDLYKQYSADYLEFKTRKKIELKDGIEEFAPLNYRIKLNSPDDYKKKMEEIVHSDYQIESIGRNKLGLQEIFVSIVKSD